MSNFEAVLSRASDKLVYPERIDLPKKGYLEMVAVRDGVGQSFTSVNPPNPGLVLNPLRGEFLAW